MLRLIIKSFVVLLFFLAASIIVPAIMPASAQCTPRTDWGIYTVARGDTLYGIARRYSTTPTALIQGNCLVNPNLLLVGQALRVPPGITPGWTGSAPEFPNFSAQTGSTYQEFERGFMIWRADTGSIWVFVAQGSDSGHVNAYPLYVYGGMSGDARYWEAIPPGLGLPHFGFKKVYDNFPEVRAALGWAIGGEQGYLMSAQPYSSTSFAISLPDQRMIRITNRSWSPDLGGPPPPPTTYTTGATFQPFQYGFMVWRAGTGEIRVFFGTTTGELAVYPLSYYGPLPEQIFVPPTTGYWYPVGFGFNKVWHNIPGVRERLGWPTGSEQGYTMVIGETSGVLYFTLPSGHTVYNTSGNTWTVGGGTLPTANLPFGEIPPTPTVSPDSTGPMVSLFSVGPTEVMPGDTVYVNWEVYGVDNVGFTVKYQADYRLFLDYTSNSMPAVGSTSIAIPTHTDVYNSEATIQLYWVRGTTPENWQIIDGMTRIIYIRCPYPLFWNPSGCGQAPPQELPAVYQPFERGFMLRVGEAVYPVIFNEEHQASLYADIERVELGTPPEGLYAPDTVFVDAWTSSPRYQELLGWATAPAQNYAARTQTEHYTIRSTSNVINNYVTLPDGQIVMLSGSVLGGPAIRWDWVPQ